MRAGLGPITFARLRPLAAVTLAAISLTAVGCGGDDGGDDESGADSAQESRAADRAAAIRSCIEQAGLTTGDEDASPTGVDDPVARFNVAVAGGDDASGEASADVFVFETPEIAGDAREAITLQTEDDATNKLLGEVVVDYSEVPDDQDAGKVEGCV